MEQLYKEYENSVAVQSGIIEVNRIRLAAAKKSHDFKEVHRLNSLLKVLYEEKWELEERKREIRKYLGT